MKIRTVLLSLIVLGLFFVYFAESRVVYAQTCSGSYDCGNEVCVFIDGVEVCNCKETANQGCSGDSANACILDLNCPFDACLASFNCVWDGGGGPPPEEDPPKDPHTNVYGVHHGDGEVDGVNVDVTPPCYVYGYAADPNHVSQQYVYVYDNDTGLLLAIEKANNAYWQCPNHDAGHATDCGFNIDMTDRLVSGVSYSLRVKMQDWETGDWVTLDGSPRTLTCEAPPPPPPPCSDPTYSCSADGTEVTISWSDVGDKYWLRMNQYPYDDWVNLDGGDFDANGGTGTSITVGISPDVNYQYSIEAGLDTDTWPYSGEPCNYDILQCAAPVCEATTPASVTCDDTTDGTNFDEATMSTTLEWSGPSDWGSDCSGDGSSSQTYRVYGCAGVSCDPDPAGDGYLLGLYAYNVASAVTPSLSYDTTYRWYVVAENSDGETAESGVCSFTVDPADVCDISGDVVYSTDSLGVDGVEVYHYWCSSDSVCFFIGNVETDAEGEWSFTDYADVSSGKIHHILVIKETSLSSTLPGSWTLGDVTVATGLSTGEENAYKYIKIPADTCGVYTGNQFELDPGTCELDLGGSGTVCLSGTESYTASITSGSVDEVRFSVDSNATVSPSSDASSAYQTVVTGQGLGSVTLTAEGYIDGVSSCSDSEVLTVVDCAPPDCSLVCSANSGGDCNSGMELVETEDPVIDLTIGATDTDLAQVYFEYSVDNYFSCTGTSNCSARHEQSTCEERVDCIWEDQGECEDDLDGCNSIADQASCEGNSCDWYGNGSCSVIPGVELCDIDELGLDGCIDSPNCSGWGEWVDGKWGFFVWVEFCEINANACSYVISSDCKADPGCQFIPDGTGQCEYPFLDKSCGMEYFDLLSCEADSLCRWGGGNGCVYDFVRLLCYSVV